MLHNIVSELRHFLVIAEPLYNLYLRLAGFVTRIVLKEKNPVEWNCLLESFRLGHVDAQQH